MQIIRINNFDADHSQYYSYYFCLIFQDHTHLSEIFENYYKFYCVFFLHTKF